MATILTLIATSILILGTARDHLFGLALPPGSAVPDLVFYAAGALIGAAGGALLAAARTLLIDQAAGRVPMTEAFGLYALAGKATAFLGPLLIGAVTAATGSQTLGISPVILLFAAGLFLLRSVKTGAGALP